MTLYLKELEDRQRGFEEGKAEGMNLGRADLLNQIQGMDLPKAIIEQIMQQAALAKSSVRS